MNPNFAAGMEEATRLTRSGRLNEATALIQRLLNGGRDQAPASTGPTATASGGRTIEADYVVLDTAEAAARPEAPPKPGPRPRASTHGKPHGGLAETLAKLKGMAGKARPAPVREPIPEGAAFLTESFGNAAGTRNYRLYVPARRPDGPMPLLVMLHGCTQDPDDFAAGTRMNAVAEEFGFLVAYPEQPRSANPQGCWNWFKPEDQRRDRGEPSILAGIVRQIAAAHPVDKDRVYVAGLSAGGAAAAVLATEYPDLFAAVGVHSGLPAGVARDMPSAFQAMRQGGAGNAARRPVPAIVFHGDRDGTVHPANGEAVTAQLAGGSAGLRSETRRERTPDGHAYSRTIHQGPDGRTMAEHWTVHGAGHAWMGGSPNGSHTDPRGPDASRELARFLLRHRLN